ncbi:MAG TPA: ATP-binding protein [Pyrinomonadaceae bacterium]|jgi:hypothetical protein
MANIISLTLPEEFGIYRGANKSSLQNLEPLAKVNIFVGSNNSGKSRFMRLLSTHESYQIGVSGLQLEDVNVGLKRVLGGLESLMKRYGLSEANRISVRTIQQLKNLPISLSTTTDNYGQLRQTLQDWSGTTRITSTTGGVSYSVRDVMHSPEFPEEIRRLCQEGLKILKDIPAPTPENNPKRVYMPILRGLRPLDDEHTDFYEERTKQDYFRDASDTAKPEVFSGLKLYGRLTDLLLGSNPERKIIAQYQEFISEILFEGRPITLIPSPKNKVVTVKIGRESDRPIYELGDGIQSAIILSFLPFVMKEPTFFFIEEPESHLHPGLQRKILDFFSKVADHKFFLTVHSNHLLDVTIDIKDLSVFTFRKHLDLDSEDDEQSPTFTVENVDATHRSSLELLGVRNSSVFLVNATIWVEGITDRWYLRSMLNSYMDYLAANGDLPLRAEEDVHYCFVEYGGGNITHWSFLDYEEHPIEVERLCAQAMLVVDQDGKSKLQRKEDLQNNLGDRLIILPCREIENTLPYEIIKAVVLEFEKTPERDLPDFEPKDYQDKYLGRFVEEEMLKGQKQRRGSYAASSGTINSKVDFCERAIRKIHYETLPEPTQAVVQQIYQFVCQMNT